MHGFFTRTLERRGIYTGSYHSQTMRGDLPRPFAYAILHRRDSGMVRIEIGLPRRSFWVDWGNHAGDH